MLDFNHILATPGYDLQQFYGEASTTLIQWQTWKKPRGVNWVYMIGVGGGGGGGTSRNTAANSGGGGGGGSGAQSSLLIPSQFVPDMLYIQAGFGGAGPTGQSTFGGNGQPSYVCIEPDTTLTVSKLLLSAGGGTGGSAGLNISGAGGTGGAIATIASMCLAGRGVYNFVVGQTGGSGGAVTPSVGTGLAVPATGLMVMGGAGGGGASGTAGSAGGSITAITGVLGTDFFPLPITAGAAASGATPAGAGGAGLISRNFLMNFGGAGGGGASGTVGGNAGAGGDAAPGCGGGGAGGMGSSNPTVARGGNGGGGFVIIISW
jgi:hypothetical protein